jgi:uncharacterized protein
MFPKKREEGDTISMKPRITVITLGVDDLDKSLTFYRDGLGLPTQGIIGKEFEYGAVVFFDLQNDVKLALWPRKSIAHDTQLPVQAPSATEFTLAQNVSSKEEVDMVMEQAKKAGAKIIKSVQDTFYGGYAGYFQDPDTHVWEIAWNPQLFPD